MANYSNLIAAIQATIYNNGQNLITGSALQGVLIDMVQELGQAGAVFGGVVDRDFVPATTDSNIFYVASVPGTYSGFNQSVSVGEFAIFYFDGTDWQKATVTSAEVEVTTTNQTGVNLATISVGGQSYQIRAEKKDTTPTIGSSYAVTSNGVAAAIASAVNSINNALALKADTTYVDNQLALKADKVAGAVNGNMAALDANGNLTDSGIASSAVGDVANKIDRVAGAGVGNVAMFDAIGGIEDSEVPVDNLAQQDGYYSPMIVGAAENLVGQDVVSAQFTRRVSGGSADVGTGAALIKSIKGNTLVWNQHIINGNFANGTTDWSMTRATASVSDGIMTVTPSAPDNTAMAEAKMDETAIVDHYYYRTVVLKGNAGLGMQWAGMGSGVNIPGTDITGNWQRLSNIKKCTATDIYTRILQQTDASQRPFYIRYYFCVDLTAMFGSTIASSMTAAEFEALFPLNYYANVTPFLLNNKAASLVTTGFNQWDEEWEVGTINSSGNNQNATDKIRSKNYIPVFPSTAFYIVSIQKPGASVYLNYYNAEKNFISRESKTANASFTTPANCYYLRFTFTTSFYGTVYLNDICINLSDTDKNGTYEPYEKHTLEIPLTTMTGKVNGEGESVVMFPEGARRAGTAFDETDGVKSWDRLLKIDLGSLNWTQYGSGPYSFFYKDDDGIIANNKNATCVKYVTTTNAADINNQSSDKSVFVGTNGYISNTKVSIWIYDSAYGSSTAAQFKAAMDGVYIYVERATPIEYVNDSPLALQFVVNNDGTEEITPENGSTPTTAPFSADIQYAMNAVDTLRNLPKNYISKASMDSILTAFKTAGVITAYTLTWDATNQKYNCTITV